MYFKNLNIYKDRIDTEMGHENDEIINVYILIITFIYNLKN